MQALDHQEIVPKDDRGGMVKQGKIIRVLFCAYSISLHFIDKIAYHRMLYNVDNKMRDGEFMLRKEKIYLEDRVL